MKFNKKALIPLFTLASLLALSVGTTYAIFTKNNENVTQIKAGKINVISSVSIDALYSAEYSETGSLKDKEGYKYNLVKQSSSSFSNGGTVSYVADTNSLSIQNITPGDKVEFTLNIENKSLVETKYRFKFIPVIPSNEEKPLVNALDVIFNNKVIKKVGSHLAREYYLDWTDLDTGVSPSFKGSIYYPLTASEIYQGKSVTYKIEVEVVQNNAKVFNNPVCNLDSSQKVTINETEYTLWDAYNMFDNVIFGETKDYEEEISGLTGYDVDADDTGTYINAYIDTRNSSNTTLYILSDYNIVADKCYDETLDAAFNGMFVYATSLKTIKFENFDTSNITSMNRMFFCCESLTTIEGLTNFDTSNVVNMSSMFSESYRLTTLDLSSFNTSSVTDMNNMFYNCYELTTLDLSNFDTSNVTDMSYMFQLCNYLTTLDISSFDTSNVTNMQEMFKSCCELTTIYASDKFVTTSVTNSQNMFYNCTSLNSGSNPSATPYNSSYIDKTYARLYSSDNPGYFTAK